MQYVSPLEPSVTTPTGSQGEDILCQKPRALPWAILSRPFRALTSVTLSSRDEAVAPFVPTAEREDYQPDLLLIQLQLHAEEFLVDFEEEFFAEFELQLQTGLGGSKRRCDTV